MRAADQGAAARKQVDWQDMLALKWSAFRFGPVTVETKGEQHIIVVEAFLDDASPDMVRVEVYADGTNGGDAVRQEMTRLRPLPGEAGGYAYSATVSSARPATDYTARIMPRCDGVAVPLEDARILWQR
jgi:starch phosphorylase